MPTERRTRSVTIALAVVAAAASCRSSASPPSERADADDRPDARPTSASLLREFEGSYPLVATPNGVVRSFDITAEEAVLPLVDGTRMRVWAYNGSVPGPTLRIRLGETLRVRFTNKLPQPTTIHWHGVRVPNGMDGVPNATQPPIAPGETFVYEFTPKDAGTFWFHPHMRASEQVERGLYGALVVEDAQPAPYTRDVVWVLDDWLLDERGQIVEVFNTMHELAHDGRWGNSVTVNASTHESLSVRSGDRIRLRMINSANARVFSPDFTGLDAKIIAIDGLYLREPIAPHRLEIAPGNRVDLDITFSSVTSERVSIVDRFYPQRTNHLADIVIDGIADSTPSFDSPARAHVPRWQGGLAMPIDQELRLNARSGGPLGIEWTINDKAFEGHMAGHAHAAMATLKRGSWYRFRFTNESGRLHPIHMHGMFFRVLARNDAPVDEPFFRDTVLVHPKEIVDVGLVPLDEGSWMLHCHILEHAEAGMMTMIDVVAP